MKVLLLIPISIFIIFIPSMISTFAIPADQNSAMLKSWVLPIPAYENNSSFEIDTTFGGYEVYFVESNSNKIGRLVPIDSTITEWSIPTNSSMPVSISVDPSTNTVYFVESNSNKIGRLVPSTNTITEWSIPTNSSMPVSISVDPSTNTVYFVESNSNKIGRLVPQNEQFVEWDINGRPIGLDIDSSGSIYF